MVYKDNCAGERQWESLIIEFTWKMYPTACFLSMSLFLVLINLFYHTHSFIVAYDLFCCLGRRICSPVASVLWICQSVVRVVCSNFRAVYRK